MHYITINNVQIYFFLLLPTLNVPLQIGKCAPGAHVDQVGNPCSNSYRLEILSIRSSNDKV